MEDRAMNATDTIEALNQRARERYRKDARFHALTQSIVNRVLNDHGPVDPERADREAYDIATKVAAMVIESLYLEDQELAAQREIAERYKKLAEDALMFAPPRFPVIAIAPPNS